MMDIRNMFDNDMREERYERMLDRMGLQKKRADDNHMFATIGLFGMGMAVGAALGMLFAPKKGEKLRREVIHKVPGMRRDLPAQEEIYEQTT